MTDVSEPLVATDGDNNHAVQSLQMLGEKHTICAVDATGKDKFPIISKFFKSEDHAMKDFIATHNGKRNLYFVVNTTKTSQNKKPSKVDMESAEFLYIDYDMDYDAIKAGTATIESEQERILADLTHKLPKHIKKPNIIIFSGGGYQAFWRINSIELRGDPERCKQYELYNKYLEGVFNADSCHNCDRIMRIPGTINIPTAKKLRHGRELSKAVLMTSNAGSYDISEFKKFVEPKAVGEVGGVKGVAGKVDHEGGIIQDLAELDQYCDKWDGVSDRTKTIIAQGNCPNFPLKEDGSARTFYIASLLQSHGVPQKVIMQILLDDGYKISTHCLSQKDPKRAAERAITKTALAEGEHDEYKEKRIAKNKELAKKKEKRAKAQPKHDIEGYDEDTPFRVIMADFIMKQDPWLIIIKHAKTIEFGSFIDGVAGYKRISEDDYLYYIFSEIEKKVEIGKPMPLAKEILDTIKSRLHDIGRVTYPEEWINNKNVIKFKKGRALNLRHLRDRSLPEVVDLTPLDYTFTELKITAEQFINSQGKWETSEIKKIYDSTFQGEDDKKRWLEEVEAQGMLLENEQQLALLFYGQGGTGKTTHQERHQYTFGKKILGSANEETEGFCVTAPQSVFVKQSSGKDDAEGLACIRNARVVLTTETASAMAKMNTEVIKSLATGDTMTGRVLYKGLVSFEFKGLVILHGNTLPSLPAVDSGLTRRMRIVTFNHDQRIKGHERKKSEIAKIFAEEAPIALRRMFDVAKRYIDNGSVIKDCAMVKSSTNEYFMTEDSFIDDLATVVAPNNDKIASYDDIVKVMVDKFPQTHKHLTNRKLGGKLRDSATYGKSVQRLEKTKDHERGTYLVGYEVLPYTFKSPNGSGGGGGGQGELGERSGDTHANGAPMFNDEGEALSPTGEIITGGF